MGTMQNIGLMAQKAEEYGSHPTTFELAEAGTVTVTGADGVTYEFLNVKLVIFGECLELKIFQLETG